MNGLLSDILAPASLISLATVVASGVLALVPLFSRARAGALVFLFHQTKIILGVLPPRKKVWGTVYDADTKRPIPFARVQLCDHHRRVLETRIADADGRYGFLTSPESLSAFRVQVTLAPAAGGYRFPSKIPASIDTFVYNNLYYGDSVVIDPKILVNFDIPMDPILPSRKLLLAKSPSIALGAGIALAADIGFWVGMAAVPLNFLLLPNPFTFGIMCLFLGTASLRLFGILEHPFGTIVDHETRRPVPFALITLTDAEGRRMGFSVSDELGRYFLLTPKGTYRLAVITPANIQPTRQITQNVAVNKGWLTIPIAL